MPSTFEREVQTEIERLEGRVERLREFLDEMKEDIPESPTMTSRTGITRREEEDQGEDQGDRENGGEGEEAGQPLGVRGITSAPRRQPSRPNEQELAQLLMEAPTNKNGSVDLRTDVGRTLRAYGMVDQLGFPTEEAESLLKTHGRARMKRTTSGGRKPARR